MCILLVEDEPLIRALVMDELSFHGLAVCEAETGDQAAALIETPPAAIRLLITDIHLPGQRNGLDVARLLRQRHRSVPIIYTTGRPDALTSLGPLGPNEVLMCKPYSLAALLAVVHRLLVDHP
jgi:DNA-binding response OmpR family regulator